VTNAGENRTGEEIYIPIPMVHHEYQWTASRLNWSLRGESPATKCLSHVTAQEEWYYASTLCDLFKENALSQTPVGGRRICTRRIPFNSLCWEPLIWLGMAVLHCSVLVSKYVLFFLMILQRGPCSELCPLDRAVSAASARTCPIVGSVLMGDRPCLTSRSHEHHRVVLAHFVLECLDLG
jgi:hypothetical protein